MFNNDDYNDDVCVCAGKFKFEGEGDGLLADGNLVAILIVAWWRCSPIVAIAVTLLMSILLLSLSDSVTDVIRRVALMMVSGSPMMEYDDVDLFDGDGVEFLL